MPRNPEVNRRMRQQARSRILSGALEVFARRGPRGASMSAVARRAGVSKGLAYRYFESKEELLAAVLESRLEYLLGVVDSLPAEVSPDSRLRLLIDELLDGVAREPQAFRLYVGLTLEEHDDGELGRVMSRLRAGMDRYLEAIRELMAALGSPEPETDALLLRSTLMGLCVRLACANRAAGAAAVRERLHRLFSPPPRSPGPNAPSSPGRSRVS